MTAVTIENTASGPRQLPNPSDKGTATAAAMAAPRLIPVA